MSTPAPHRIVRRAFGLGQALLLCGTWTAAAVAAEPAHPNLSGFWMLASGAPVEDPALKAKISPGTVILKDASGRFVTRPPDGLAGRSDSRLIDGSSVGKVFGAYVEKSGIDLLVMGGYRHSPVNEWFWGGMTNTIINEPPCWVFLSH